MATRSGPDAARIVFYVAAILMAIYGLGLLLFPQAMFTLSQDPGVPVAMMLSASMTTSPSLRR
jgi:hypothetical protein